jgi:hypothetical protein
MANVTTSGPATRKETVYNGPSPASSGTVYNGPSPATGGGVYSGPAPRPAATSATVYGGPAGGTVYSGPGSGTVYNPRQAPAQQPVAATRSGGAKGAGILFLIAGFSLLNTLLVLGHAPFVMALGLAVTRLFGSEAPMANLVFINVMAVGVVVLLGLFVRHGSKAALLIAMLLYAGDTALFFIAGDASLHAPSIFVHVLLLGGMFKAFTQMEN